MLREHWIINFYCPKVKYPSPNGLFYCDSLRVFSSVFMFLYIPNTRLSNNFILTNNITGIYPAQKDSYNSKHIHKLEENSNEAVENKSWKILTDDRGESNKRKTDQQTYCPNK